MIEELKGREQVEREHVELINRLQVHNEQQKIYLAQLSQQIETLTQEKAAVAEMLSKLYDEQTLLQSNNSQLEARLQSSLADATEQQHRLV